MLMVSDVRVCVALLAAGGEGCGAVMQCARLLI